MSDARLYIEMSAVLEAYDENRVGFRSLLNRLEECADHIEDDLSWQEDFRRVWDRMEIPYALAADKGLKHIPDAEMPGIIDALGQVKKMVADKVAEMPAATDK